MELPKVMLMNLPWVVSSSESASPREKTISLDSKSGLEHVGLLYLETILKEGGIPTEVHDLGFKAYHYERASPENCIDIVKKGNPDVVGFSPYFTSIDDTFYVAEQIKRSNPRTKIILGGSHASHTAKEILEDKLFIDAIFLGEAFGTVVPGIGALLESRSLENMPGVAFRNNGSVVNNGWGPRIPLDELTIPKRSERMYDKTKTASMVFSMGCPAACTFCSAESLRDRSWRTRSPDSLIAEIDYLTKQFGIEIIETHSDDGFGRGKDAVPHYTNFAQKLIDKDYNISWRSILRATDFSQNGSLLNDEFWRLLHRSGLERVYIGFEAGTNERLRTIHKPATVEHNLRAFRLLTEQSIAVQYGFIMFFPDSTTDEIGKNLDFLYELKCVSYSSYSSSLIIHPGSAYFDIYRMQDKLQRPHYGLQQYQFPDASIRRVRDAYHRFIRGQYLIDTLCNDLAYATVGGDDSVLHLGHDVKVDSTMLERRAKELYITGRKVLQNPQDALVILGEFNERWRNEYLVYLKKMQKLLEDQDERGLFPTIGQKGNDRRELQSTFLHTFVLEYLLDHHSEEEAEAIQKGIDFLISQAIDEKGTYVWQWLKNPPREEDYRPPDTDDTMRARLVIEKGLKRGFSVPSEFKHFNYEAFLYPLMADDGSVRTYVRDRHSGSCPIVNTNVLYALTSVGEHDEIRNRIKLYLSRGVDTTPFDPDVFTEHGRYYISPLFPVYVLSKTMALDPDLFSTDEKQRVLEYAKRVTPKNILERAWQSSVFKNVGQEISAIELSFEYIPIFRSRKLKEVYGSKPATVVFCLEAR